MGENNIGSTPIPTPQHHVVGEDNREHGSNSKENPATDQTPEQQQQDIIKAKGLDENKEQPGTFTSKEDDRIYIPMNDGSGNIVAIGNDGTSDTSIVIEPNGTERAPHPGEVKDATIQMFGLVENEDVPGTYTSDHYPDSEYEGHQDQGIYTFNDDETLSFTGGTDKDGNTDAAGTFKAGEWYAASDSETQNGNIAALGLTEGSDGNYTREGRPGTYAPQEDGSIVYTPAAGSDMPVEVYKDGVWLTKRETQQTADPAADPAAGAAADPAAGAADTIMFGDVVVDAGSEVDESEAVLDFVSDEQQTVNNLSKKGYKQDSEQSNVMHHPDGTTIVILDNGDMYYADKDNRRKGQVRDENGLGKDENVMGASEAQKAEADAAIAASSGVNEDQQKSVDILEEKGFAPDPDQPNVMSHKDGTIIVVLDNGDMYYENALDEEIDGKVRSGAEGFDGDPKGATAEQKEEAAAAISASTVLNEDQQETASALWHKGYKPDTGQSNVMRHPDGSVVVVLESGDMYYQKSFTGEENEKVRSGGEGFDGDPKRATDEQKEEAAKAMKSSSGTSKK